MYTRNEGSLQNKQPDFDLICPMFTQLPSMEIEVYLKAMDIEVHLKDKSGPNNLFVYKYP